MPILELVDQQVVPEQVKVTVLVLFTVEVEVTVVVGQVLETAMVAMLVEAVDGANLAEVTAMLTITEVLELP
jgi:hypothetical protein